MFFSTLTHLRFWNILEAIFRVHVSRPPCPRVRTIPTIDEDALALALDEVMPVSLGSDYITAEFASDCSTH
jgi:hypothetical protein